MLFALTGAIQTGKTRWLCRLVERLGAEGVRCAGVIAPGVWRGRDDGAALSAGDRAVGSRAGSAYEKLGIDNVLLPDGERVPFARRVDLACEAGAYDRESQSARAGLGWAIDDSAIERVNAHFDALMSEPPHGGKPGPSLLVVDELGRLELVRGEGLVSAAGILDAGPSDAFPTALIVVRADLLPLARERFEPAWGPLAAISPDDEGECLVRAALRRVL